MYTTCVIWLAFVPLYFGTGNHVPLRLTSMSVTISLSASVTVACLFSPKVSNSYAMHALNYYCSSTNNLGWLCAWLSASSLVQKQSTLVCVCVCVCLCVWFESAYRVRYSSFAILPTNHWNFVMMWCQFSDPLYKPSLLSISRQNLFAIAWGRSFGLCRRWINVNWFRCRCRCRC